MRTPDSTLTYPFILLVQSAHGRIVIHRLSGPQADLVANYDTTISPGTGSADGRPTRAWSIDATTRSPHGGAVEAVGKRVTAAKGAETFTNS